MKTELNDFNWESFTLMIVVKSSLSIIYSAWTKAFELKKWFLESAAFLDTNNAFIGENETIKKGYSYQWKWYLFNEIENGIIIDTNNKDSFRFTFAGESIVNINLKTQDDNIVVELTQHNIPTDDFSKKNIRLGCELGWTFYLVNLKSIYEGGLDLRNKNDAFKEMINN